MKRFIFLAIAALILACQGADAKRMSDLKIYINPGHGGYTSNDRPIHIYPFEKNDSLGYWESKSNLYKGLHMYHILDSLGAKPMLSRIKNTEADDRSLSGIAAEANQFGADLFFSIHSNAGEDVNYPLMLYRENTIGTPRYPENVTLSEILGRTLYSNQLPLWTNPLQIAGDLTFYQFMWEGGLGVLRTLYTVGLLSEGGMHEHRPECYRLMNDDYWYLEAWHFVHAIMEYFDTEDRFVTGLVAGIVRDDHNLREKDMPVAFTVHGRDNFAPVNGCKIELVDAAGKVVQTRTTDNLYNGVYVFRSVAPGTYTVRTSHGEYYDSESTVVVKANEVTYNDFSLAMRREFPLEIVKCTPVVDGNEPISCATVFEFDFNTDVDEASFEKALRIEPHVDGYFTYSKNYHHATFTPAIAFEKDTHYTLTVSTEAKHPDTRYSAPNLAQPLVIDFTTGSRNRLAVLDQYPVDGGEQHFASPQIEIRFDCRINNLDILEKVKIVDSKGNDVQLVKTRCKFNSLGKVYGNMTLSPSANFEIGETYTVTVSDALRDTEGLPMDKEIKFTFTAVDNTAGVPELELFEGFETGAPFKLAADKSTGYNGSCAVAKNTSTKIVGGGSAKISYEFKESDGGEIVWNYTGDKELGLSSTGELGMYVNGDLSHHDLFIGLTAGDETKWVKACALDFVGWRYVDVPLADLESGKAYQLSGFKLGQVESPMCVKGSFFVDNIGFKAEGGVDDITLDDSDAPAVYYNLQGIEVANPGAGIFIERRGNSARKVVLP